MTDDHKGNGKLPDDDEARLSEERQRSMQSEIRKMLGVEDEYARQQQEAEAKKPASEQKPPQQFPPEYYVDGKFVDILVYDDYVIAGGTKLMRKEVSKSSAEDWRRQWEFIRKRIADRGPLATANQASDPMIVFRKMLERGR